MGNAAYMYISIAFIQMLKALMVVAVYGFGVALGTEVLTAKRLVNVSVISLGVVIASYGGTQPLPALPGVWLLCLPWLRSLAWLRYATVLCACRAPIRAPGCCVPAAVHCL